MFEQMEITETIYEGVVEPYLKKPIYHMLTVLSTKNKREEYPPNQNLTLRRVIELESVIKGM